MNNDFLTNIPALKEKTIIDMFNIDNSDLILKRKSRTFFKNMIHEITGGKLKEENLMFENINAQMKCLQEYIGYFQDNELILMNSIDILNHNLTTVSDYLIETREVFIQFQEKVVIKIKKIENEIKRLDSKTDVSIEISNEFAKLNAKKYQEFSVLEQIKIVLENLYFGKTGYFIRNYSSDENCKKIISTISNKIITFLNSNFDEDIIELDNDKLIKSTKREETEYLFDYNSPYSKTLQLIYNDKSKILLDKPNEERPIEIPYFSTKEQLAELLVDELNYSRG